MNKAELMQKEIENKRKLPNNLKQEAFKNMFQNLLVAIIIMAYLCIVNVLFYKLSSDSFEKYLKYFSLGLILATVVVFEIAYRRDSKRVAIIGIELLTCSIFSLYVPYIYILASEAVRRITIIVPIVIAIYYVIKAIVIYKGKVIVYHNNMSDVKEILKDTEKESYIDEDSSKTFKANMDVEEKIKKELLEEQILRKNKSKNKSTSKKKK